MAWMERYRRTAGQCRTRRHRAAAAMITVAMMVWAGCATSFDAADRQEHFPSAEAAVAAMVTALKSRDAEAFKAQFGPESDPILSSGDPVADRAERERFLERYAEQHHLEADAPGRMTLYVGNEDWPFAIPIVEDDKGWRFDTTAGAEELLARRIGRNELNTIQVCLAYVDAQREYASQDRDDDGILAYAERFASEPGTKNGLYWEAGDGEPESPLGPLFTQAQEEGYLSGNPSGESERKPAPYHGYFFRILTAQGENALGGAYDYQVGDRMIGGFALVAYPAQYGVSGIMTFVTSHEGVIYQKDLGDDTAAAARKMDRFNPDSTWAAVEPPS